MDMFTEPLDDLNTEFVHANEPLPAEITETVDAVEVAAVDMTGAERVIPVEAVDATGPVMPVVNVEALSDSDVASDGVAETTAHDVMEVEAMSTFVPMAAADDSAPVYQVERVLAEHDGRFLVRWRGYASSQDTWEPEARYVPAHASHTVAHTRTLRTRACVHASH